MDNFTVKGDEVRRGTYIVLDAISKGIIESLSTELLSETMLHHLSDGQKPTYPTTAHDVAEAYKEQGGMVFALRLDADQSCIGFARLGDVSWQGRHAHLEISIVDEQHLSVEMLTDAIQTVLQFTYWEANLNRIYVHCIEDDSVLREALERVRFTHEGDLRQEAYRNGHYLDIGIYSMLQKEWGG